MSDPCPLDVPAAPDPYRQLVDAIVAGAVLFVGAGSSCKAGHLAWSGLLAELEREAFVVDEPSVVKASGIDGLLRASEYKRVLGQDAYHQFLRRTFAPRTPAHQPEHETLVSLPFKNVLTTNYDGVLHSAHRAVHGVDAITFDADEWSKLTELRQRQSTPHSPCTYVHLHGSVARPEGIVLCLEDYDQRYHRETGFKDFLRDMITGQRLVFLGFSLEDEDFLYVLREAVARAKPLGARHFAILPRPATEDMARVESANLRGKYGIEAVYFDNGSGDYAGLWELVARLRRDVDAATPTPTLVSADAFGALLEEVLADHPDLRLIAERKLPDLLGRFGVAAVAANIGAGGATIVDQEIDNAFTSVAAGRPDEAIAKYESIRTREGDRLTMKQRYRLDANIGNAWYAMGNSAQASQYYLRASGHYQESRDARGIKALGFLLAGDRTATRRLTEKLCTDEPEFPRGWSLWVRAQEDTADFSAIESQVPDAVRGDAEVALALADLAARAGNPDAQVTHARAAVSASPEWPDALSMLGGALVTAERRYATFDVDRGVVPRDRTPVLEAESFFTKAIAAVGDRDPGGRLGGLHFNRSVARWLLGREAEALADVREAFRHDAAEPAIALAFAMDAEMAADVSTALDALGRLAPGAEYDDQVKFAAAWLRLRRGDVGDVETALNILDDLARRLDAVTPLMMRWEVVRQGLRARGVLGQAGDGPAFVEGLPANAISEHQRTILRARAFLQAGRRDMAAELAAEGIARLPGEATWFDRREAAMLATECGLHAAALELWMSVIPPGDTGSDTLHLVHAAYLANEWRTVLDVCATVRAAGRTTRRHLIAEVEVLASSREPERAMELLRSWVSEHPSDRQGVLYLSALALREGRPDLAVFDSSQLPSVDDVSHATEGGMLVHVLRRGPRPAIALDTAYALYRRFPEEHDAHMALAACVFDPSATPLTISRPTRVGEDCAALVGREGEQARWIYVETHPAPVASRGEYSPAHEFVRAMWGRAAGETFEHLGHTYRVAQVENRVLRRVHEIMERYEENFPERKMLRRFSAPLSPAPDAPLREKLGEMYEVLNRDDRNRQLLESMYRQSRLPIASFAKMYGRPVFDVVRHMASDRSMGVRADDGDARRWPLAVKVASRSLELVLDGTVLAGALVLGLLDELAKLGPKLIVPRAVLDEVRKISLDAAGSRFGRGTIGLHEGRFFLHESSPDEIAREVERLDRVINFIQSHCEVVGGEATLDLPTSAREAMDGVLDNTSIDATALAMRRGCPLWTDDLGLQRLLAAEGIAVPTVWTQAVVRSAHDAGKLSQEKLDRVHASLIERGYTFTRLSADDIVGIMRSAQWRSDRGAGEAVVRVAAEVAFLNPHNAMIVALAMKQVWELCPDRTDAKKFVLAVLRGVGPSRDAVLARFIYGFRVSRRVVRVSRGSVADHAGAERPATRLQRIPFDPFRDAAGRSLKRFLRAWRCRDGEFTSQMRRELGQSSDPRAGPSGVATGRS